MVKRFALALLLAPTAAFATTNHYVFSAPQSSVEFTATENNVTILGNFASFKGEADFDALAPEAASVSATIDTGSASSTSADVATNLKTPDWFDSAKFPQATFTAHGFKALGGNKFETQGTLTLKGVTQPVTLDFTLVEGTNTATVQGTAKLTRTAYKVGWADTHTVADPVVITVKLHAVLQ